VVSYEVTGIFEVDFVIVWVAVRMTVWKMVNSGEMIDD
jgi:hypothetical protein